MQPCQNMYFLNGFGGLKATFCPAVRRPEARYANKTVYFFTHKKAQFHAQ